jgi:hypothetical protein
MDTYIIEILSNNPSMVEFNKINNLTTILKEYGFMIERGLTATISNNEIVYNPIHIIATEEQIIDFMLMNKFDYILNIKKK